ncbi:ATP-binding protein [Candidatus Venteria ishoeyi]|uniref:histidine kinase n=1 Tax=Candidatus Venteria ishoeyi TaxID=1899563 RepID=A0A1H6FFV5_9GAMM|nr:ATP-binding protein [Candidatus Venteria ishoeyi]SEH08942.1 Aerobic respiration control sensor protein ArcB [Candidatus Venteria ishoeyi]
MHHSRQDKRLHTLSIHKTISLSVLVMISLIMLLFIIMGFKIRNTLLEHEAQAMHVQWATLAESSIPALLFDDEKAATELLNPLQASPKLVAAVLLYPDGRELAHYGKTLTNPAALPEKQFTDKALVIHQVIYFENKTIGSLVLVSDMGKFRALEQRLLLIFLLLLGFALSVALLISKFLNRRVSMPLARFVATTDKIARSGDYSQRIHARSGDEFYTFAHGFNMMLEAVQQRDQELLEHKTHLEEMVAVRTADLEQAKEAAESANRAKSAFLASMSHELRTPLNAVLGYAQILQHDVLLNAGQQQSVATIKRSGEYLLTLINDVLDLAKIEAGRLELIPGPCELSRFFTELSDMFRLHAIDKGITFQAKTRGKLPDIIKIDEKRLRQVCLNLLGNAIKFTEQGTVNLETEYQAGKLLIRVIDSGIGIPETRHKEIFNPFHQTCDDQYKQQGTGLGLAISHSLVKQMQGCIKLDSETGHGSCFSVMIPAPVLKQISAGKTEHQTTDTKTGSKIVAYQRLDGKSDALQVLVVDDNQDNRAVLRGLLEPLGFVITEAEDGLVAMALTEKQAFDVILMDLVMPKLDGLSATRRILARTDNCNHLIIAISARAFKENYAESLAAGCQAHLCKPIDNDALLRLLQTHLSVKWCYAENSQRTEQQESGLSAKISCPATWFDRLEQAVVEGSRMEILSLLNIVKQQDEKLGSTLASWAESYESKRLLEWIEKNRVGQ